MEKSSGGGLMGRWNNDQQKTHKNLLKRLLILFIPAKIHKLKFYDQYLSNGKSFTLSFLI